MCVSKTPGNSISKIGSLYELKEDAKELEMYLKATIWKWQLPDGREVWSISGMEYLKEAVSIVNEMLRKEGRIMIGGKRAERPYPSVTSLSLKLLLSFQTV